MSEATVMITNAKLKWWQVQYIRAHYKRLGPNALAKEFNVSPSAVYAAYKGTTWKTKPKNSRIVFWPWDEFKTFYL